MATALTAALVRHLFTKKAAFALALGYSAKLAVDVNEHGIQEADNKADALVEERVLESIRNNRCGDGKANWSNLDAAMIVHFYRHKPEQLKLATSMTLVIDSTMHASEKFKRDLAAAMPLLTGVMSGQFDGPEQMLDSRFQGSIKFPTGIQRFKVVLGRKGGRSSSHFSIANPTTLQRVSNFFGRLGFVSNDKTGIVMDAHADCPSVVHMSWNYQGYIEPEERATVLLPLSMRVDGDGRVDGAFETRKLADVESLTLLNVKVDIPQSAYDRMSELRKFKHRRASTLIFKSAPKLRKLSVTEMTTDFDSKRYPIVCDGLQQLTVHRASAEAAVVIEEVLKGGAHFFTG